MSGVMQYAAGRFSVLELSRGWDIQMKKLWKL